MATVGFRFFGIVRYWVETHMVMSGWWWWWRLNSSRDWWVGSLWRVNTIKATHPHQRRISTWFSLCHFPRFSFHFLNQRIFLFFKLKDLEFSHPLHSHPTNRPLLSLVTWKLIILCWLNQQNSSSLLMWTHSDIWIVKSKMYFIFVFGEFCLFSSSRWGADYKSDGLGTTHVSNAITASTLSTPTCLRNSCTFTL